MIPAETLSRCDDSGSSGRGPGEPLRGGAGAGPMRLAAGIVAHNEASHLEEAVLSLLGPPLPPGVVWDQIWIVASGCTDGTDRIAHRLAEADPRVRVVVEPERLGKSAALGQVFARARGDALVLLNADARAGPGALPALLEGARRAKPPFALMARPVPRAPEQGWLARSVSLQWALHHELHIELVGRPEGNHLSDELLLLSWPGIPTIPGGIVNDGTYFGAWLVRHGGELGYVTGATVEVEVPRHLGDHLAQRRRIRFGHRQVEQVMGVATTTLPRFLAGAPARGLALVRRAIRSGGYRRRDLALLVGAEVGAAVLAGWDGLPPQRDHVRWRQIRKLPVPPARGKPIAEPGEGGGRPDA